MAAVGVPSSKMPLVTSTSTSRTLAGSCGSATSDPSSHVAFTDVTAEGTGVISPHMKARCPQ